MSGEGFLGRWSRRKRAALAEPLPPVRAAVVAHPAESAEAAASRAGQAPAAAFDPASLPPVDTLTAASEVRDFLREGVPAALRQAALRRVWALDPAIAGFIGPADYAWDFNAPDGMAGFAQSMPGEMGRMLAQAIGLDKPRAADEVGAGEADDAQSDAPQRAEPDRARHAGPSEAHANEADRPGRDGSDGLLAGSTLGPDPAAVPAAAPVAAAAPRPKPHDHAPHGVAVAALAMTEPAASALPKRHGAATPV